MGTQFSSNSKNIIFTSGATAIYALWLGLTDFAKSKLELDGSGCSVMHMFQTVGFFLLGLLSLFFINGFRITQHTIPDLITLTLLFFFVSSADIAFLAGNISCKMAEEGCFNPQGILFTAPFFFFLLFNLNSYRLLDLEDVQFETTNN